MDLGYWANALKPPLLYFISAFVLVGAGWLIHARIGGKLGILLLKVFIVGAGFSLVLFCLGMIPVAIG